MESGEAFRVVSKSPLSTARRSSVTVSGRTNASICPKMNRGKIRMIWRKRTSRQVGGTVDLRVVASEVKDSKNTAARTTGQNGWEKPCLRTSITRKKRPTTAYMLYI
jgi:hypothetical protein